MSLTKFFKVLLKLFHRQVDITSLTFTSIGTQPNKLDAVMIPQRKLKVITENKVCSRADLNFTPWQVCSTMPTTTVLERTQCWTGKFINWMSKTSLHKPKNQILFNFGNTFLNMLSLTLTTSCKPPAQLLVLCLRRCSKKRLYVNQTLIFV